MFPIENPRLQNGNIDGILAVVRSDNVKARAMQPDGNYLRAVPDTGEPHILVSDSIRPAVVAPEIPGHNIRTGTRPLEQARSIGTPNLPSMI